MTILLKIISFAGLGLTIIPSVLVLSGTIDMHWNKLLMSAGMVVWFAAAYFWVNKSSKPKARS